MTGKLGVRGEWSVADQTTMNERMQWPRKWEKRRGERKKEKGEQKCRIIIERYDRGNTILTFFSLVYKG